MFCYIELRKYSLIKLKQMCINLLKISLLSASSCKSMITNFFFREKAKQLLFLEADQVDVN